MHRAIVVCFVLFFGFSAQASSGFKSDWNGIAESDWIGADYWANRLQDWKIKKDRLHCVETRKLPMRTLNLLSYELNSDGCDFLVEVDIAPVGNLKKFTSDAAAGILIGIGHGQIDYRVAALVHNTPGDGAGLFAGIDARGNLFIHDFEEGMYKQPTATDSERTWRNIRLQLKAVQQTDGLFALHLQAWVGKDLYGEARLTVPAERVTGAISLVSHCGVQKSGEAGRFSYKNWLLEGERISSKSERALGPVLGTQYTVSKGVLKMTAQMMPVNGGYAVLELRSGDSWYKIAKSAVYVPGYTATFRVQGWDDTKAVPYRVRCSGGVWSGTVRINPRDKDQLVMAAFTGNHNMSRSLSSGGRYRDGHSGNWMRDCWFPHTDIIENIIRHNPDILFFSGDQVYESASPSFPDSTHLNLDYLYKWYLYLWAFRDLTKDIPTVCIPDDHDVFQGNLWGQGGRHAKGQNDGGYVKPAEFVRMVERTQTSNLPDPYDPTPVEQGIGVYYTSLTWGGISFAILEDRKFKVGRGAKELKTTPEEELPLLGQRQLDFIDSWVRDWEDGAVMKASLTATVFGSLNTWGGKGVPCADTDTNGWPAPGRDRALRALRKGATFMIGGDQHLATVCHHGIDKHNDAGWSFCVPSIANYFPRSWEPKEPGANRKSGQPTYQGEFLDGFGNPITMYAVANPGKKSGHEPTQLHDKVPGYGIIRFDKPAREIIIECWPRYAVLGKDSQYSDWPITISQLENDGRKPTGWLPDIKVDKDNTSPVVEVIDEETHELVYARRFKGPIIKLPVYAHGSYTVLISSGDDETRKIFTGISPEKL